MSGKRIVALAGVLHLLTACAQQTFDAGARAALAVIDDEFAHIPAPPPPPRCPQAHYRLPVVTQIQVPDTVLDALAALRRDPVRYDSLRQRLAAALAMTRLTWEVRELQDQLAAAEVVNAQLTDAERRLLAERLTAARHELDRVVQEKETAERHLLPVVDTLLAEYAAVQTEAARVGFQAPSQEAPPVPFRRGGQLTAGFGY